ncbi:MAG: hypothetical protein PHF79_02535 [Candidatus Pacebacteria bacterium]|nr:hypothetical protein [Candidatus Paceibacterota bacterium]
MNFYNQHNQFGNNYMNFGPQPRQLNDSLKGQLKSMILSGSKIIITSVLGDGEAYNFATQMKEYLEQQGYGVDGINQAIYSKQPKGQIVEPPKETGGAYNLIIGNNL